MKAFGCQQTAANPSICARRIADSVAVIAQDNTWQALRSGSTPTCRCSTACGSISKPPGCLMSGSPARTAISCASAFTGDFTGPIPEDGTGWGYQLEAVLCYRIDDNISVGVGGRYWHMEASGYAHFEDHVVGTVAAAQVLDWKTDHYGVFLQGTYTFGPF